MLDPVALYTERQKSNPVGKIRYLWNCSYFFHRIYSVCIGGFRPHILQISLHSQRYNYLKLNVKSEQVNAKLNSDSGLKITR